MNILKLTIKSVLFSFAALAFTACEEEEPQAKLVDQVLAENGYSVLVAALSEADLIDDLQGSGPFTIFAPNDAAFASIGVNASNVSTVMGLENILLYHVIQGSITSADLTSGEVTMLNGDVAEIDASAPSINGITITTPLDIEAGNGVIHTLSGVLTPPKTIVDLAVDNNFSILAAGLVATGLDAVLSGSDNYTVFAPTDEAFAAAGIDANNIGSVPNIDQILLYHVVSGIVTSSDLIDGKVETVNGKFVTIDATNLTVDGAGIASPFDVEAKNGIIHTVNSVLLPKDNIVETALASDDLSILAGLVADYPDILDALSNESSDLTVFAPNNAAFEALLGVIGQSSIEDVPTSVIENILYYHVLGSPVRSTDLSNGLTASTLNTEDITVSENGGEFLISGVGIEAADVETSNGVVHVMNGVLVPPTVLTFVNTIVEPAYFNKDFSKLVEAVVTASPAILETLLGDGPSNAGMTLFAPVNSAFDNLYAALGVDGPGDIDVATLDAVLTYHLLDGVVAANGLPQTSAAAPAVISAVGGDFYLSNKGGGVFINGNSQVIGTDVDPSEGAGNANGIVHVINETLVPPSNDIVQIAIDNGFSKLAEALTEANLVSTLQGVGPFTVFAPTDAAFDALYSALGVSGPSEIDDALLEDVLLYHVLGGVRAFSTDLTDGLAPNTASDANGAGTTSFTLNLTNEGVTITDGTNGEANITNVNILATNGVIHIINTVILPQ